MTRKASAQMTGDLTGLNGSPAASDAVLLVSMPVVYGFPPPANQDTGGGNVGVAEPLPCMYGTYAADGKICVAVSSGTN